MEKIKIPSQLSVVVLLMPFSLFSQNNEKLIRDYISHNKLREYKKQDLANFIVENRDPSKSLKGEIIKFQQTYKELPIHGSAGVALIRDNTIIYYTDNFVKNYTSISNSKATINKKTILQKIADNLGKQEITNYPILAFFERTPENQKVVKQRLVYKKHNDDLVLCYEFILPEPKSPNYWNILINANSGEIISKANMTSFCNFSSAAYSHGFSNAGNYTDATINNIFIENLNEKARKVSPDNASYNVFALPIEAPTFGSRSIVNNPWVLSASPEGWHSDGINHYTDTKGNNTETFSAELDDNLDVINKVYVSGGNNINFDFPFNPISNIEGNLNASVSDLFYTVNMIHDIYYKLGFTETAKNFQKNNFGNGGLDNDPIEVISFKLIGNNAGYDSTPDGTSPRLAIYLYKNIRFLQYIEPVAAQSRKYKSMKSFFGPALTTTGMIGNVKRSEVIDACTSLAANSLANKIGLMRFGNCEPTVKVKNAQNAGAIAAIIYNDSTTTDMLPFQGNDSSITIPTVRIDNAEGEYISWLLSQGTMVNVKLVDDFTNEGAINASLDKSIVIHEYTHGLSNRLTGTGFGCLNTNVSREQMGEGWSDFYALMLTNRPEYNSNTSRGHASYAEGEQTDGLGDRPAKYSTSFSINNYTYGMTNGMEQHSIGFVWATMLWDLHWKYAEKYGYSSDVMANTINGSTRILQLVIDGLKLQPCNPTFIEGRDAILAADQATTGGEDKCMIWNTFARRGLGINASAGSKTNINDQVEDFTIPSECKTLSTNETTASENTISTYPNPAGNEFFIKFPDGIMGKVNVEIYDMSGKLVSEEMISPNEKKTISTGRLENGTYLIKVKGLGYEMASKVIIKK